MEVCLTSTGTLPKEKKEKKIYMWNLVVGMADNLASGTSKNQVGASIPVPYEFITMILIITVSLFRYFFF